MRCVIFVANLITAISAFTITSPSAGEILDPTEPITFSWTSDSSDPATFEILLDNSASGGLTSNVKVATDVATVAGSYILSTSSVKTYGTGFVLKVQSSSGDLLATSPSFTLAMNSGSSPTYTGSVSEGPASTSDTASTSASTASGTDDSQATLGSNSASSTASNIVSTTGSNSFTTSTISRSGGSTGTASSSSASATTSQNAQPKLGSSSQIAFTAAGLIAGLAALLA